MTKYISIPLTSIQVGWLEGCYCFPWDHLVGLAFLSVGRNEDGGTFLFLGKLHIKWP